MDEKSISDVQEELGLLKTETICTGNQCPPLIKGTLKPIGTEFNQISLELATCFGNLGASTMARARMIMSSAAANDMYDDRGLRRMSKSDDPFTRCLLNSYGSYNLEVTCRIPGKNVALHSALHCKVAVSAEDTDHVYDIQCWMGIFGNMQSLFKLNFGRDQIETPTVFLREFAHRGLSRAPMIAMSMGVEL